MTYNELKNALRVILFDYLQTNDKDENHFKRAIAEIRATVSDDDLDRAWREVLADYKIV